MKYRIMSNGKKFRIQQRRHHHETWIWFFDIGEIAEYNTLKDAFDKIHVLTRSKPNNNEWQVVYDSQPTEAHARQSELKWVLGQLLTEKTTDILQEIKDFCKYK